MRYLSDFTVYVLFVFIFDNVIAYAPELFKFPGQYYQQNGQNPPSRQYYQNIQQTQPHRSSRGIPVELAMKLSSIQDVDELFTQYIENGPEKLMSTRRSDDGILAGNARVGRVTDVRQINAKTLSDIEPQIAFASVSAFGASPRTRRLNSPGVGSTRISAPEPTAVRSLPSPTILVPKPATCMPEQRTVNLRDSDDPTLYYYPSCTRVDRCGGCCLHDLLSCQPKAVEYLNYSVHVSKYTGKPKLEYQGTKIITVEKHTKCKCECKVKAEDCTAQQKYEEDDCRCVCTNKEDEAKCSNESKDKLWNPATCSCQCREVHECPSGYSFNPAVCRCDPNQKANILPPDYAFDTRYKQYPNY